MDMKSRVDKELERKTKHAHTDTGGLSRCLKGNRQTARQRQREIHIHSYRNEKMCLNAAEFAYKKLAYKNIKKLAYNQATLFICRTPFLSAELLSYLSKLGFIRKLVYYNQANSFS